MAQIDLNTGSSFDDPTADEVKTAFDSCQSNFDELYDYNDTYNPNSIKRAYVSIGAWDMDTDSSKSVAWTLPGGSILLGFQAFIYPDANETITVYPIDYMNNVEGDYIVNGGINWSNNSFALWRRGGSGYLFDAPEFNATNQTRGYILVEYT